MPARAPRPGAGRRIQISHDLKQTEDEWVRITVGRDGADLVLLVSSIGPNDERNCESQAGLSIWAALGNPTDVRSISLIYWMARRKNGEKDIAFHKVAFRDVADLIAADVDLWVSDPDGDEDVDLGEGGADPTSPAGPSETTGPPSPTSTGSTPGTSAGTPS